MRHLTALSRTQLQWILRTKVRNDSNWNSSSTVSSSKLPGGSLWLKGHTELTLSNSPRERTNQNLYWNCRAPQGGGAPVCSLVANSICKTAHNHSTPVNPFKKLAGTEIKPMMICTAARLMSGVVKRRLRAVIPEAQRVTKLPHKPSDVSECSPRNHPAGLQPWRP